MKETFQQQLARVEMMSEDDGETWDLSRNDQAALKAVVQQLREIQAQHRADIQMQVAMRQEVATQMQEEIAKGDARLREAQEELKEREEYWAQKFMRLGGQLEQAEAARAKLETIGREIVRQFQHVKRYQHEQLVVGQTLESASMNWEMMEWPSIDFQPLIDFLKS